VKLVRTQDSRTKHGNRKEKTFDDVALLMSTRTMAAYAREADSFIETLNRFSKK